MTSKSCFSHEKTPKGRVSFEEIKKFFWLDTNGIHTLPLKTYQLVKIIRPTMKTMPCPQSFNFVYLPNEFLHLFNISRLMQIFAFYTILISSRPVKKLILIKPIIQWSCHDWLTNIKIRAVGYFDTTFRKVIFDGKPSGLQRSKIELPKLAQKRLESVFLT